WPSPLTGAAPVGCAIRLTLAARLNRPATATTGLAHAAVYLAWPRLSRHRCEHHFAGQPQHADQLFIADLGQTTPGIEAGGKAAFALEDVADAGDTVLIQKRLAQGGVLATGTQRRDRPNEIERRGSEDVWAERGEGRVATQLFGPQDTQ